MGLKESVWIMAEAATANFSRSFGPAQFELPRVPELVLPNLADISAENFEFASNPAEDVQVTTSVNRLNGPSLENQNVLTEPPQIRAEPPQSSTSIASQEQGVGNIYRRICLRRFDARSHCAQLF